MFSQVRPVDLLQLARTNRRLRYNLLTKKLSKDIWHQAYAEWRALGLPDLEGIISEPAFAALISDGECQVR